MTDFLILTFVFLAAGVIAVPLATRFGLGSVLGYLLAGIIIAPLLRTLGVDVEALQHFAEFGVVLMLLLVGLELEPERLWRLRAQLLGLGGLQVLGTAAAITAIAASGQSPSASMSLGRKKAPMPKTARMIAAAMAAFRFSIIVSSRRRSGSRFRS